jgi:GPH family glycoside/pentoside/hexuronide:cation symporter
MAIQLLVVLFLVDTLYTAIATSLYIMPYEMAVSNKARGSIYVWKLVFMVFSTAIPLLLFNPIKPKPGEDPTSFILIMAGIGIAAGAVIFLSTFQYEEKHFQRAEEQIPFFRSLKECFRNFSFIIFEVISFTVIFAQTGLMQGVFYYFDEIPISAMSMYGALAVGIIIGIILFIRQRDRWGVKRCVQVFCLAFAAGCFTMLFFGRSNFLAPLGFFLVGIGFAGGMYLIPLMNGDVIDKDEERTGLRREGMYAGVNSFITKPAISLAQAIFLWALKNFGYIQGIQPGTQSLQAQDGILIGWMLGPAILLAISFIALHWYPLTGPAWNEVKKKLEQVHAEKERHFLAENGYRVE